ncbi:hypothetical protein CVT25_011452 [Psilocybe cyanescens]|uniref:Uncharacterized protein n=1 Tax=Psilocybe cyanescens TaxID=93625 RepID=A0A409XAA8_PSICY|nr:hypothetical protein CVT25_011452 [Psilocybe cyanescens]
MSAPAPSFSFFNGQENVISADFNSTMLYIFLMGIYTTTYTATMYLYLSRKARNSSRNIVTCTISILYLLCICECAVQWRMLQISFIDKGNTRASIFESITVGPGEPVTLYIVGNIFFFAVFIVADALLIWRCYHIWGRSLRIVMVLLLFLFLESGWNQTGLFAAVTIIAFVADRLPTTAEVISGNNMQSAQIFMSFGTTVMATFLIAYKILNSSTWSNSSSKNLFKHVVAVVIESASVYSVSILVFAVFNVIPSSENLGTRLCNAKLYAQAIITVVGGMAPTILVARIALTNSDNTDISSITHISGIQFEDDHSTGDMQAGEANTTTTSQKEREDEIGRDGKENILVHPIIADTYGSA